ncbi:uncharacterized protein METZ01_LOCUS264721, partial [marine metagenome]
WCRQREPVTTTRPPRTNAISLRRWKSANMIRWCANTWPTRSPRSS